MPELHFKGKEFVYNHHLSVPYRPLIAHPEKSVGRNSENMIIHGDNLHALKALLPRYAGKVDAIIIDPPYNTGEENWSYNDNVNSTIMREWLNSNPVNKDDLLRHDKWLCMMYPRLKLLKELLSSFGFIAVTIDDNEIDNLLLVLDEIFEKQNRLAIAVWLSDPSGGKQKSALRIGHEYIVIYGGGDESLRKEEKESIELNLEDEFGKYAKGREINKWGANSLREDRPTMYFPLINPEGNNSFPIRNDGKEGCWRFGQNSSLVRKALENPNYLYWGKRPFDTGVVVDGNTERWVPYQKVRDDSKIFGWSTWLDGLATNADGTNSIKQIFGKKVFETPKPVALIEWIIDLATSDDSIILDNYAGSGTTAHAVLNLNQKDGGSRRFILIECEDYADQLTAERIRRVINGYEYEGTNKEELIHEKITWTTFCSNKKRQQLLDKIQSYENLDSGRFDKINKEIKNGELLVTGEKSIKSRVEGVEGDFTFFTLGEPLDIDNILIGKNLPDYANLGAWLFHTATGEPLDQSGMDEKSWYLGASKSYHVWLVYKPDLDFLKSREAVLTLSLAEKICATRKDKPHLVFAPDRYVPNKSLHPMHVEYARLPFAIFRMEKE